MRVDIYASPTCGYCHQAKRFLEERGIHYFEYDISHDQDAAERMMNLTGQMGVPVLVIDGQVVIGFDRARIESMLGSSGNGRRSRLGIRVADANRFVSQNGAYIGVVESNSPGARAGLHVGDVIVSVDSTRIDNVSDLENALSVPGTNGNLTIGFVRSGQLMQADVIASN